MAWEQKLLHVNKNTIENLQILLIGVNYIICSTYETQIVGERSHGTTTQPALLLGINDLCLKRSQPILVIMILCNLTELLKVFRQIIVTNRIHKIDN